MGKSNKQIGCAQDYYRIRVQRIEEEKPVDLEWRTDVLYATPKAYPSRRRKLYLIQLVRYDKCKIDIAYLADRVDARQRYDEIKEDLGNLTKYEFDNRYGIGDTKEVIQSEKSMMVDPVSKNETVVVKENVCE